MAINLQAVHTQSGQAQSVDIEIFSFPSSNKPDEASVRIVVPTRLEGLLKFLIDQAASNKSFRVSSSEQHGKPLPNDKEYLHLYPKIRGGDFDTFTNEVINTIRQYSALTSVKSPERFIRDPNALVFDAESLQTALAAIIPRTNTNVPIGELEALLRANATSIRQP